MATNPYFNNDSGLASEQTLYEDLIEECIQIHGHDLIYLPRETVTTDDLLGEDIASKFGTNYTIEMYVETTEGYGGGGDLISLFGQQIQDESTLVVMRRRWTEVIGTPEGQERPYEGDLVYVPFSKSLFVITEAEHEEPFYQLVNLPVWKLRVSLFKYNGEDLDIDSMDTKEIESTTAQVLTLESAGAYTIGETVVQIHSGTVVSGEVLDVTGATIRVGHVSSSAGDFHLFTDGIVVTGDSSSVSKNVVSVAHYVDAYEQNDLIETEAEDTLFDSSNPFGIDY